MNAFHDDRCPKCNRPVSTMPCAVRGWAEIINHEPARMGEVRQCAFCDSLVRYTLDTFDPIIKGSTMWEVVA